MYKIYLINGNDETLIHGPYFSSPKLLSGSIKEGINVADNFTFSMLPNNPGYNKIYPLKSLITVENTVTGEFVFDGFVFMPTESMDTSGTFGKSFTAVSELGYLTQTSQRHGEYHDITVRDFLQVMIDSHNSDVANDPIDKQFKLGIVDVDSTTGTLYRYLGYEDTLSSIKDKLLDRLDGELRVRKVYGVRYLDYVKSIGSYESTEIRIAKNLQSITKEIDPTEIITRLIPLGERIESEDDDATDASEARLTIESVNNGKDYIIDKDAEKALGTIVVKSESWDDITVPAILKTRGLQHLKENNKFKIQHSLSALDLHLLGESPGSFNVGSWYPVFNPVMNINENLRVVAKNTDIIIPENNELNIGDKFKTASQYQAETNATKRDVVNLKSTLSMQRKRVRELSQASATALQEIQTLHDLIDSINSENIENTLDLIVQQIIDISEAINDIGYEITELELRTVLLEDFKIAQSLKNHENEQFKNNQETINQDVEDRLSILEGDTTNG